MPQRKPRKPAHRPRTPAAEPERSKGLAAISSVAAREFLLQSAELPCWNRDDVADVLGVDAATAEQAIAAFEMSGYIERAPGRRHAWRNTAAGNSMAGVPRSAPVKRETAQKNLDALVGRIAEVNRDPRFIYRVDRAVLFGPFLNANAGTVKNVDVAIELSPKEKDVARLEQALERHAADAENRGKRFKSYADRRNWGANEVREFLKSRTRSIALYDLADWVLKRPHRALYP